MLTPDQIHRARGADVLALAAPTTTLRRVASTGGGEYAGPCPLCGGRDRFHVQAGRGRWLCRGCSPRWDDAIALAMKLTGQSFAAAVRTLAGDDWTHNQQRQPATLPPPPPAPTPRWQARARQVAQAAAAELWTARARPALHWLLARGLAPATLRHWRVGYLAQPLTEPGVWWGRPEARLGLGAGVLLPLYTERGLTALKLRRLSGAPKYGQVRGGGPGLYLAATLTPAARTVAVCEGEFDALLLWQALQATADLPPMAVVTPGSQAPWPRPEWLALLQGRRVLLLFDQDAAGEQGAQRWLASLPTATRVRWPKAKDLTDLHLSGGSLSDLIRTAL